MQSPSRRSLILSIKGQSSNWDWWWQLSLGLQLLFQLQLPLGTQRSQDLCKGQIVKTSLLVWRQMDWCDLPPPLKLYADGWCLVLFLQINLKQDPFKENTKTSREAYLSLDLLLRISMLSFLWIYSIKILKCYWIQFWVLRFKRIQHKLLQLVLDKYSTINTL